MQMEYKPKIDLSLKRIAAFWEKDILDRPPLRIRYPINGTVDHDWPREYASIDEYCEYWMDICRQRAWLADDYIPVCNGAMDANLMPAIMGCSVKYEHEAVLCDHPLKNWDQLETLSNQPLDDRNDTIVWLKSGIEYFSEQAMNKCAVSTALLVGPGDLMAALRSSSQLCLDLIEEPEQVHRLAKICTMAIQEVLELQFAEVPRLEGGYCDPYNFWTPGKSSFVCDDFSSLISSEMYEEFVFPYDCRLAEIMESSWMHIHSSGIRILEHTLKIPNLKAVQICYDGEKGPSSRDLLPWMQKIQKKHCLLLRKFPYEQITSLLPELSPEGLYIDTQCDSRESAERMLADWTSLFA